MALSYKPPRIGTFTKRMTIQEISTNQTADGGTDEDPENIRKIWCSIESLRGEEKWLMKAQQDQISHVIRCCFQSGITPQMRGLWNGRTFNFTSVLDIDERHVELEIEAIEIVEPST
jgi:SPP1 family predicted phage head-tail adaptor